MNAAEFEADLVVDARDCILGRVASQVADRALDGERVAVVHAEDAVVTGDRVDVFEHYRERLAMGSDQGPNTPKRPDTIMKRSIRGMVPHKRQRGRDALARVRVYVGNPYESADDEGPEPTVLPDTSLDRLSNIRFVHLHEISEQLGATPTW